jgi:hypothetical protein
VASPPLLNRLLQLDAVEAEMLAETRILGGNDGAEKIGRNGSPRPPLAMQSLALEQADNHQGRNGGRHHAIEENAGGR